MAFVIEIMPSALAELKAVKAFLRRVIAKAIDEQLPDEPTVETKNRKPLPGVEPSFEFEPPLWELRIRGYRVLYDVSDETRTVYIRAIRKKPPHARTEDIL